MGYSLHTTHVLFCEHAASSSIEMNVKISVGTLEFPYQKFTHNNSLLECIYDENSVRCQKGALNIIQDQEMD